MLILVSLKGWILKIKSSWSCKPSFLSKVGKSEHAYYLLDEEDEVNQSILESAISSSTRDPMQAHNLEQEEVSNWIVNLFALHRYIKCVLHTVCRLD